MCCSKLHKRCAPHLGDVRRLRRFPGTITVATILCLWCHLCDLASKVQPLGRSETASSQFRSQRAARPQLQCSTRRFAHASRRLLNQLQRQLLNQQLQTSYTSQTLNASQKLTILEPI